MNGMYCICYPLPNPLFYWAFDTEGENVIAKNDWEKYGIPELKVRTWIGSHWTDLAYDEVRLHLQRKNYQSDGRRYARDHGYPELIRGDPHERRMEEIQDSVSDEDHSDNEQEHSGEDLEHSVENDKPESSANDKGLENSNEDDSSSCLDYRSTSPLEPSLRNAPTEHEIVATYPRLGSDLDDLWVQEQVATVQSLDNTCHGPIQRDGRPAPTYNTKPKPTVPKTTVKGRTSQDVSKGQPKQGTGLSQKPFSVSIRTSREFQAEREAGALPNSSEKQAAGQRTTRPAKSTREISTPARRSQAVLVPTALTKAKTTRTPLSLRPTEASTRSTQSQTIEKATVAPNPRRQLQTTNQQATGPLGTKTAKPVLRERTPSQPVPAQRSRAAAAAAPTGTTKAKTTKRVEVSVSPKSIVTPTRSTRKGSCSFQPTEAVPNDGTAGHRLTGSKDSKSRLSKTYPTSASAGKLAAVPNETPKRPKAEQDGGTPTGSTKQVPTKFNSAASQATHSQMTRKTDCVKKTCR
ncbi:hypothetical protein AAF712_009200 [Marasmius tenuissimus]|uniref:Uncharacterized protein n=1 Tax=Marasmius tenuissimus TaxID=585030 RepID=A0ABR2ZSL3_9AGAR